jgi:ribonuclease R
MITNEAILDFMREKAYKPMTYQELEKHFGVQDAFEFKEFLKTLNQLEQDGEIIRTRNDRYGVPERMNLLRGRLQAHTKGFGFLIPDEPDHPDVYIHANDMNSAMNGDTVFIRVTGKGGPGGGRLEGEVVRVITRANTEIVGTFQGFESYGFVVPDDKRINRDVFIPQDKFMGAVDGTKVVVRIVKYPEGRAAAEGEVIEVLGHKDDPGVDILSIIRKFGLPEAFHEEVILEADAVPDTISDEELLGRRDLRGKRIVTIDGEDAKDLDDAVGVERLANGNYVLTVSIADVGYYVKEGSALDREAYNRGCSVYLVDRVIPMLPHRLSNGICSLNPKVDRLTLTCEM